MKNIFTLFLSVLFGVTCSAASPDVGLRPATSWVGTNIMSATNAAQVRDVLGLSDWTPGQAANVVSDLTALAAYSGAEDTVLVSDANTGGTFTRTSGLAVDGGIVVTNTVTADVFKRQFSGQADAMWWGLTETGDQYAVLQAALTWCAANDTPLFIPAGRFEVQTQLDASGVSIRGAGRQATTLWTTNGNILLNATGSSAIVTTLSGTHSEGGGELTVTDALTLNAGTILELIDSTVSSYTRNPIDVGMRTIYKAGQQAVVLTNIASTTTVPITKALWATYNTNATPVDVYQMSPTHFSLHDICIDVDTNTTTAVRIQYGNGVDIRNVRLLNGNYYQLVLTRCRDVNIDNALIDALDDMVVNVDGLLAYGISTLSCENVRIVNSTVRAPRHAITIQSSSYPSRFVTVSGCTGESIQSAAFDSHGAAEYITWTGNHMTGLTTAGNFITVSGNTIIPYAHDAGVFQTWEMSDSDFVIANNVFKLSQYIEPIIIGYHAASDTPEEGNLVQFVGNTIYAALETLIAVKVNGHARTIPTGQVPGIRFANNTIYFPDPASGPAAALFVDTDYLKLKTIEVHNNSIYGGSVRIRGPQYDRATIADNVFVGGTNSVYIQRNTTSIGYAPSTNNVLTIAGNSFTGGGTQLYFGASKMTNNVVNIVGNRFTGPPAMGSAYAMSWPASVFGTLNVRDNVFRNDDSGTTWNALYNGTAPEYGVLNVSGNEYIGYINTTASRRLHNADSYTDYGTAIASTQLSSSNIVVYADAVSTDRMGLYAYQQDGTSWRLNTYEKSSVTAQRTSLAATTRIVDEAGDAVGNFDTGWVAGAGWTTNSAAAVSLAVAGTAVLTSPTIAALSGPPRYVTVGWTNSGAWTCTGDATLAVQVGGNVIRTFTSADPPTTAAFSGMVDGTTQTIVITATVTATGEIAGSIDCLSVVVYEAADYLHRHTYPAAALVKATSATAPAPYFEFSAAGTHAANGNAKDKVIALVNTTVTSAPSILATIPSTDNNGSWRLKGKVYAAYGGGASDCDNFMLELDYVDGSGTYTTSLHSTDLTGDVFAWNAAGYFLIGANADTADGDVTMNTSSIEFKP